MEFNKNQKLINPADSVRRQHAIPADVHAFGQSAQMNFKGKRGRGRSNVPTLPDIYYVLTKEGFDLVAKGKVRNLKFVEIGRPEDCVFAQIVFETSFDDDLRKLKETADAGTFVVEPYKEISLISLAVNLMRFAIAERQRLEERRAKKSAEKI